MPEVDFKWDKPGGHGKIIQVAETMLNFKAKIHRSLRPSNRTVSLCIVEFRSHITRAFLKQCPKNRSKS